MATMSSRFRLFSACALLASSGLMFPIDGQKVNTKNFIDPISLTELERLKATNILLRIENVSARLEILVEQHRRFTEMRNILASEQAAIANEMLAARKLDPKEWFVNWQTLEIEKRPPPPVKKEDTK